MRKILLAAVLTLLLVDSAKAGATKGSASGDATHKGSQRWQIGAPIATYAAGPKITDAIAKQMAEGGFNLLACDSEEEMDIAHKYGIRVIFSNSLLTEATMDNPVRLAELETLIARIKNKPSLYAYFVTDEPDDSRFPGLGKIVQHLRELDPAHLAYINLLPTYAYTEGDTVAAYKKHLRNYMQTVKPDLLSYDHYNFRVNGDQPDYFLNLGLIRQEALKAGIPFLNIIQAARFGDARVPNENELRWLNYTSLAYGAQGISYFVYYYDTWYNLFKPNAGQMMLPDGTPTQQYQAAKTLNPQFVAIASQLQPLSSLGAYHLGKKYEGTQELPHKAPFQLVFPERTRTPENGMLLGYFGKAGKATHALAVNLDYRNAVTTTVVGPEKLSVFDVAKGTWKRIKRRQLSLTIPPGGGTLVKIGK